MGRYVIRRSLQSLLLLFFITVSGFTLYHVAPNVVWDDVENPDADAAEAARSRARWGLDDPLPVQYTRWLFNVLRGDFGISYFSRQPVLQLIGERVPNTVTLAAASILLGYAIGVPLGIYAGLHRGSVVDRLVLF